MIYMIKMLIFIEMTEVFGQLVSQYGIIGLLLAGVIYLIIDGIKTRRKNLVSSQKLDSSIGKLEEHVDSKIDDVNERIDTVNEKVDTHYDLLTRRIEECSTNTFNKIKCAKEESSKEHLNNVMAQFSQSPRYHKVLKLYRERINCDHIFLGTFHNGSTSINGIPYCKFDIIAEKFKPGYNSLDNREYTVLYKDSDIIVHDNLPLLISQEDHVYYKVEEDGSSPLEEIDDILYRRCIKYGIKQIAINLIRDENMVPIGFVGCVDFKYDEFNFKELSNCAHELEEIYNN